MIATPEQIAAGAFVRRLTPRTTKYIPWTPTPKQHLLLCLDDCEEILFGGAAGGAKSIAILMCALQYMDCPDYAALILRRSYKDLSLPGALMDVASDWLRPHPEVKWRDSAKTWEFPSGATLTFGYLDNDNDVYQYQSAAFQFLGPDELTQFSERQILYLRSRLRRRAGSTVPLRIRAASNPGGIGHEWVVRRYPITETKTNGTRFLPSLIADNPHIDAEKYRQSLSHLDPVTRERLMNGDWSVREGGKFFKATWWKFSDEIRRIVERRVRYWDLAASTSETACRTAGVRMSVAAKIYDVEHVVAGKWTSGDRDAMIAQIAQMDPPGTEIWIEQEPGSGGKSQIDYLIQRLAGYSVHADRVSGEGDKARRAAPFASQLEAGNVRMVRGPWNADYMSELEGFDPSAANFARLMKDQVDATSGAFRKLTSGAFSMTWV